LLTAGSRGHAQRLRELLLARKIDLPLFDAMPPAPTLGEPRRMPRKGVVVAGLSGGFVDESNKVAILTDVEIFGSKRQRPAKKKKRPASEGLSTLSALREEDLVIHVDHGIGKYLGLRRLVVGGVDGDYVHLEYADGDKLYLPIYRLSLLQLYSGPKDVRLDKLGGTRWEKTKQRVRDAVLAIAHELLALQAKRAALPGFKMPEPDEHFRAFEATFPYEETPDQDRAIKDVLRDLQQEKPMDRLVCGDVGFGKTEVAIRAAYLAVLAGKQVAVLVPTTVLAEQHGLTFKERLAGQPVTVDVLSRFRSAAESKELLARTADGKVDILIGTHRLLTGDVHFKELGLLVVDEEQRFGVKHKERLKQLRSQVHVLTMTATPIPRTLHMAVLGLRDLSIIQTAPADRLSIRTEIARFDEELVTEAIRRELRRGGQVFYVHNRIESIGGIAEMVRGLVPEARIAVAHGQMSGERLEQIMVDFVHRKTDILVCTAIIESGIDIPSANTMIVDRADTFGLAQLYQLRGRIGRGRDRGYAFLLLPREDQITKDATERLAVLKRFSELGSGFQIASHDLDLRGAGDLLGADQSGSIAAVGFELYSELLGEAVEKARGQRERHDFEPDIKVPVAAVLPESYVPQPMQRLAYYQRLAGARSDETVLDIMAEIEDVYGEAPDEVRNLSEVMMMRRRLKELGATQLTASLDPETIKIGLTFLPDAPIDRTQLAGLLQREPARYRLTPSGKLAVIAPTLPDTSPLEFLRRIRLELQAFASPAAPERAQRQ
jgi:transcription-repair coupling factor (superfamily II helicase)